MEACGETRRSRCKGVLGDFEERARQVTLPQGRALGGGSGRVASRLVCSPWGLGAPR